MNILVLSDYFWPDRTGGIAKSLLTEVEGLSERGHNVVVLSRRLDDESPEHESRDGYELYRYDSPPKDSSIYQLYPLFTFARVPKTIGNLDERYDFDVAYIHNSFQAVGFRMSSLDIPFVNVFHAPIPREIEVEAERGKYGWKTPLVRVANQGFKLLENVAVQNSDDLITRSQFMTKEMYDLYDNPGSVREIPLAVDTDRFEFAPDPTPAREELGLPLDRPILLTVRRLVARMGLENLVRAMETVVEDHPDALLLIGGKGYLKDKLERMVEEKGLTDNVRLLGFVAEDELPKYYQAANYFVMPTLELEGFGLSSLEALSSGTPVIGTPVGGTPEVIGPLDEELLCDSPSPDDLAESISTWLEKDGRDEMRQKSREYCESRFSVAQVTSSLESTFNDVTGDGSSTSRVSQSL
ncbi:glycosyltransferase family 4 protein [Haladaptatus sp. R4]|uniref:glycosyltransferase family 4 protein n=1 Tax=Haladaptatus sp. R4 TaxID=1679489 RepID=UPI0009EDFE6F|nr:glycosyltransferase family 4 protein [Haladaptatus sp. R4]